MKSFNLFAAIRHKVLFCISSSYRLRDRLERGERVWQNLDKELPPAFGVVENDIPRLRRFHEITIDYPTSEWIALRCWLQHEYDEMERTRSEIMTGREEEQYARRRQIFSEHLDAMVFGAPAYSACAKA